MTRVILSRLKRVWHKRLSILKVFIGTEPKQVRAERVLEYSIRKYASVDVEITMMRQGDPGFEWGQGPTGFTMFRFAVPELCNHEGFAIYLDCDMLLLADIAELYDYRKPGKWVCHSCENGDCVSVIDCSATALNIYTVRGLPKWGVRTVLEPIIDRSIPDKWNSLDLAEGAALIHFTGLATQPWLTNECHPDPEAVKLWYDMEEEMLCESSA